MVMASAPRLTPIYLNPVPVEALPNPQGPHPKLLMIRPPLPLTSGCPENVIVIDLSSAIDIVETLGNGHDVGVCLR